MENSGRKKHVVSGNVAEIKKSEEKVSEKLNLINVDIIFQT